MYILSPRTVYEYLIQRVIWRELAFQLLMLMQEQVMLLCNLDYLNLALE